MFAAFHAFIRRTPARPQRKLGRNPSRVLNLKVQAAVPNDGDVPMTTTPGPARRVQDPETRYAPYKRAVATGNNRPQRKTAGLRRNGSGSFTLRTRPRQAFCKPRTTDEKLNDVEEVQQYVNEATKNSTNPEEIRLRKEVERLMTSSKIKITLNHFANIRPNYEELAAKMEEHERVRLELEAQEEDEAAQLADAALQERLAAEHAQKEKADKEAKLKAHRAEREASIYRQFEKYNEWADSRYAEFARRNAELDAKLAVEAAKEEAARDARIQDDTDRKAAERKEQRRAQEQFARQAKKEQARRNAATTAKPAPAHKPADIDAAVIEVIKMYEYKWSLLKAAELPQGQVCTGEQFPWPMLNMNTPTLVDDLNNLTASAVSEFIFHPAFDKVAPMSRRERIRVEILRWHPDKFAARLGPKVLPDHREHVQLFAAKIASLMTGLLDSA